ncbi:MAG: response regulator [Spirochaetales bacterium]|nr:response regulator [Spirochaetales bacterium]
MTSPLRVLVVEDEPIIAANIERNLEYLGYRVSGIAGDAKGAIEILSEIGADIALLDIHLEGPTDGIALATKVQEEYLIPIVYVTGLADEETLGRAKITQPFGYISKPFSQRELHIALEIAVYKHQIEQRLREKELQIRHLIETMNQGFCFLDPTGRIIHGNPTFLEILGLRAEDVTSATFEELVHPDDRGLVEWCGPTFSATFEKPRLLRLLTRSGKVIGAVVVSKGIEDDFGFNGCFLSITPLPLGENLY